ncbi:MAG: LysM peptidoglycan-binding domain-containing protein [Crocinitomix sp.]|nr:LysM peptidoglycan-binding domain-containing protein [Crocinitomix sp.]
MKKIIGLVIILIGLALPTFAQPDNAVVETVDGKKYYVHIVEQGNTLYGIQQLYKTNVETLLAENKGLSADLTVGQKIFIPIKVTDDAHYNKHVVAEGETLYGISKKYKCSVPDLKALNPSLTDGISPGQEIFVPKTGSGAAQVGEVIQSDPIVKDTVEDPEPKYTVSYTDSIVEHTVLKHETLYSIAKRYMVSTDTIMALNDMRSIRIKKGDILKIPVKNVNYEVIEKDLTELVSPPDTSEFIYKATEFKESYSVALMLPLMLSKNDREMGRPLKLNQVREMYPTTKIAFDFYQGFLLAADSLSNAGLSVDIYVYDTKRDTSTIGKIFDQPEFATMDLVVGPLYPRTIKYTAILCAEKQIRIVLPFNSDADVLYQNPYVYKGVASNMTLLDGTIDYIIENHKHHNIIIVKPRSASDLALYERARERFNQKIKGQIGAYNVSIVETGAGSSSGRDLNTILKKDTTNIFIIPSTNLTFVSSAMSSLNKVCNMNPYSKNLNIIAFGLEDWNKFNDLDIKYRNRTKQHYASYRFLNYDSEQGVKFIHAFRGHYGTDPNVYSSQGFDYGMYFLSALHLYGTNFDLSIAQHQMKLTQNEFNFRIVQDGSGRENQRVCIVKYDNYKLVQVK